MLRSLPVLLLLVPVASLAQYSEDQIRAAIRQAGGPDLFIREIARQTAKSLPKRTNANVEIQSVVANGKQLMYVNRLLNVERTAVRDIEALKQANINYFGCNSPVLGLLIREHDAKISYSVVAKGTEFLFQYDLDRKTCLNR